MGNARITLALAALAGCGGATDPGADPGAQSGISAKLGTSALDVTYCAGGGVTGGGFRGGGGFRR